MRNVRARGLHACALVTWLGLTSACLYRGAAVDVDPRSLALTEGWIVIRDVPLVRQSGRFDCGVAVTTALLRYWRHNLDMPTLRRALGLADDTPVRAGQLKLLLRRRGFEAFLIEGAREDLPRHLARGRPLLVGMLKPYANGKLLAHYELVVGYHPEQGVLTMDPAAGWRRYPYAGFDREWAAAGRLMLIAVPQIPVAQLRATDE